MLVFYAAARKSIGLAPFVLLLGSLLSGCSKDPVALGTEFAEKVCECHRKAPNSSVANYRTAVEQCQAEVEKEYEATFAKLEQDPEAHMKMRKTIVEQLLSCERQMMLEGGK